MRLVVLGLRLIQGAPSVWMTEQVAVELPAARSVDLGRGSLGMPDHDRSVVRQHLRVERDAQGAWRIANLADHRKVDVQTDQVGTRFLRPWALTVGDRIRLQGMDRRR